MTDAISVIQREHNGIWRVLDTAEALAREYRESGTRPDRALFAAIFDYIELYADRVHHPKEDDYLFRLLRARAPESAGVLDELEAQHEAGPGLVTDARVALERYAADPAGEGEAFREVLERYLAFQRDHLRLEEKEVIPLARKVFTEADWREINRAFADNDDPLFGERQQDAFRDLHQTIVNYAPAPIGLGLTRETPQGPEAERFAPSAAPAEEALLSVSGLETYYGRIQALRGVDIEVPRGQIVALVGANGAGKTTLLRTISGLQPVTKGTVHFHGRDITRMTGERRVAEGIAQVPEGRQVFGPMSVEDNLVLGAYTRGRSAAVTRDLEHMYELFPILHEKRHQAAGTLSGGQQQMLAIGRAMMTRPQLMLLDEPSMGLAPLLVGEIFRIVERLKEEGITVLLVEQNASGALAIADRGYVIETGTITLSGTGSELLADEEVKRAYLGM
ncbi:ATP-binding cassette domain-containing protein [Arhodomonas aquaeolei]|uniref:ATP-binding cassette domain-containing protein n=1 Tax=Arhodomonas aquaeolei TaxID=2369 RepID=UPI000370BEA9|nr:ATP-binding cassette domain-containing protein [Arhodomonas aquaeolei]